MKLSTRTIALTAVFAALYYVLSLISPKIPAIGLPDLRIQLEALMASVFGLLLGPYLGALSALLGALVTWVLPPSGMNPLGAPFLLSPPINAFVVGLIFYRKWKWAFLLFGLLIAIFPFLPPSQPIADFYYVPIAVLWDKVIALFLIVPTVIISGQSFDRKRLALIFFLLCFIGNQADNMWGSDVFALPIVYGGIFNLPLDAVRPLYVVSPFIYPAIRLIQATIGMAIALPLMTVLRKTKWIIHEKPLIKDWA